VSNYHFISWCATMLGPAIVMVHACLFVRSSVCLSCPYIFETEIDVWLLGNSNRNPGFPVQNLPSDSRSEVRFCHFGCFRVGTSPIQTEIGSWPSEWISGNSHQSRHSTGTVCFVMCTASLKAKNTTTLGTVARPIMDDTLYYNNNHLTAFVPGQPG